MSNIRNVNLTDDQVLSNVYNSGEQAIDIIQKNSVTPFAFERQEIQYTTVNSKKVPNLIEYYGGGKRHLFLIQTPKSFDVSINNDYITLYSALDVQEYHIWFNWAGTGVNPDPNPGLSLPIEVLIQPYFTVNRSMQTILDAVSKIYDFNARIDSDGVWIECRKYGITSKPVDNGTGLYLIQKQQGVNYHKISELNLEYDVSGDVVATEI